MSSSIEDNSSRKILKLKDLFIVLLNIDQINEITKCVEKISQSRKKSINVNCLNESCLYKQKNKKLSNEKTVNQQTIENLHLKKMSFLEKKKKLKHQMVQILKISFNLKVSLYPNLTTHIFKILKRSTLILYCIQLVSKNRIFCF